MSMSPADVNHLWDVIGQQAAEIAALKQEVVNLRTETTNLHAELTLLQQACQTHPTDPSSVPETSTSVPTPSPSPSMVLKMSLLEKWNGVNGRCNVFLTNLSLVFEFQSQRYPTDPMEWAMTFLRSNLATAHSYEESTCQLKAAFQHPESEVVMDSRLYHLRQGDRSIS